MIHSTETAYEFDTHPHPLSTFAARLTENLDEVESFRRSTDPQPPHSCTHRPAPSGAQRKHPMSLAAQQSLESHYVMHTFGRSPVEFVEGHGMKLTGDDGREYLDFLAGIGVCSLGHGDPAVLSALEAQTKKLMHVSNYFYIEQRGQVAALLSAC